MKYLTTHFTTTALFQSAASPALELLVHKSMNEPDVGGGKKKPRKNVESTAKTSLKSLPTSEAQQKIDDRLTGKPINRLKVIVIDKYAGPLAHTPPK